MHHTCGETPPASVGLSSLADVELKSILSPLPQPGGIGGATFLTADVSGTDLSVSGDLALASKPPSPLVSFDAQVLGAAGGGSCLGDGDSGGFLGRLITAGADISTDLFGGEGGTGGHDGCLCGEVVEPAVSTLFDHVGDLLT
jgi:hypothetical protein